MYKYIREWMKNLRKYSTNFWQRVKDKLRGMWMGIKVGRIDNFSDHNIGAYIEHLDNWIEEDK